MLSYDRNSPYEQRSPVRGTLYGCICVWDYTCILMIGFLHCCFLMHVEQTQIHRKWEGARISDEALRRSRRWPDQSGNNRCRVAEWGHVPLPFTACATQHTAGLIQEQRTHTLLQPGQERLILTVSVHVSCFHCFKSLLVYLCDYGTHA